MYRQREPKAEIQKDKQEIFALFPRLEERRRQLAGTLALRYMIERHRQCAFLCFASAAAF